MIWFILAIILFIIAFKLHKSADEIEKQYSNVSSPSPVSETFPMTYWEEYKGNHPTEASDIERLLDLDFSKLSEKDVKEKIASVERFAKSLKCEISVIKATYLAEIEKYPAELIPHMIESRYREQVNESAMFHIAQTNTVSAMMIAWLKERHEQLGTPDAKINAPATEEEMEIVKALNPLKKETVDLTERLKSLREMSLLWKCPMKELRENYLADVKKNYDGKYENFHYLPEAFKYMASRAFDIAPSEGLKPENTSYGIMCDWLSELMEEERQRFIDTDQVKCFMCGSHDIKLGVFKDRFVCISCGREFGGI